MVEYKKVVAVEQFMVAGQRKFTYEKNLKHLELELFMATACYTLK